MVGSRKPTVYLLATPCIQSKEWCNSCSQLHLGAISLSLYLKRTLSRECLLTTYCHAHAASCVRLCGHALWYTRDQWYSSDVVNIYHLVQKEAYFNATAIKPYHIYFVRHSYLVCKLCFYHACNPVILVGSDPLPWIVTKTCPKVRHF